MNYKIDASCGVFTGCNRDSNEDNFYFNKKHLPAGNKGLKNPLKLSADTSDSILFAVFDGMGGETRGEQASCRACEVFAEELKKTEEEISTIEEKISSIDEQMASPEICTDVAKCMELQKEKEELSERLESLYEKWEELA